MTDPIMKHEPLIIAFLTGQASSQDVANYKKLYESDVSFRAHVSRIERWLSPLNAETTDIAPPESLLPEIMAQIEAEMSEESGNDDTPSENTKGIPVVTPFHREEPNELPANDNKLARWKFATLAASLIAALALGSHLLPSSQAPEPVQTVQAPQSDTDSLIALLSDSSQPSLVAIVYDPATLKVVARLSNVTLPEDGDFELWLIREGGAGPVSLGLMNKTDESGAIEFTLPESLQTVSDTLAISLEPLGGSGTETGPQGPILFTGGVTKI